MTHAGQAGAFRRAALGQSILETALVAPIILLLLLGLADIGRIFFSYVAISNSARESASFVAAFPDQHGQYQTRFISESSALYTSDPSAFSTGLFTTTEGVTVTATYSVTTFFIGPFSRALVGWWTSVALPDRIPVHTQASFRRYGQTASDIATPGTPVTPPPDSTATPPGPTPTPGNCLVNFSGNWTASGSNASIDLANTGSVGAEISRILLTWPAANGNLREISLGGTSIWSGNDSDPNADVSGGWSGTAANRTVPAGASRQLTFRFQSAAQASQNYESTINFATAGCAPITKVAGSATSTPTATATATTPPSGPTNTPTTTPTATSTPVTLIEDYRPDTVVVLAGTGVNTAAAGLLANGGAEVQVDSTTSGNPKNCDWYAEATINPATQPRASITNITFTIRVRNSSSKMNTIHLYNWTTSAWVPLIAATSIGSTYTDRNGSTTSAVSYVDAAGKIRIRSQNADNGSSYSCYGDHVVFLVTST
jgi:hypothetical protein